MSLVNMTINSMHYLNDYVYAYFTLPQEDKQQAQVE